MIAAGGAPTGWSLLPDGLLSIVTAAASYYVFVPLAKIGNGDLTVEFAVTVAANPTGGTSLYGSQFEIGNNYTYADIGFYTTMFRLNDNGANFDTAVDFTVERRVRITLAARLMTVWVDGRLAYSRTLVRSGAGLNYFGQGSSGTGNWRLRSLRVAAGAAIPPGQP